MKKIISIFLVILLALFQSVSAVENSITATAELDINQKKVIVCGTAAGGEAEIPVSVMMLLPQAEKEDIPLNSPICYMNDTISDENGNFRFEFDYSGEEGIYTIYVSDKKSQIEIKAVSSYKQQTGNVYNLPEVYESVTTTDTKSRFYEAKSEISDEMPVYAPVNISGQKYIYVSEKEGSKNGDGSIEKPYNSLGKALLEAKENPAGTVIYLRDGNYNADEVLLSSISANESFPLIISAYNGEKVTIGGKETFNGDLFESVTDSDILSRLKGDAKENVKVLDLNKYSSGTNFGTADKRILSINGISFIPARYPDNNETVMRNYEGSDGENGVVDSGTIINPDGTLCGPTRYTAKDTSKKGFEMCIEDITPFSWKPASDIWIKGRLYANWSMEQDMIEYFNPEKRSVRTVYGTNNGVRYFDENEFYYFNILEELTVPGEWYLDNEAKKLYVYPVEDLSGAEISLGYNEKSKIYLSDCKNIVFNGINFECFSGDYALEINNCNNIQIQNCSFKNMNGGVKISGDSRFCGVVNSSFENMESSYAPYIITSPSADSEISKNLTPQYNYLQNNYFYNCYSAVIRGTGNIVSHNNFLNSLYAAISVDQARECVIEYNVIENGVRDAVDMGAIYLAGQSRAAGANHIRYNYINNCNTEREIPVGIYLDEFMSRSFVYGNIIDGCNIYLNNGSNNAVVNNIILNVTTDYPVKCLANYVREPSDSGYEMWNNQWIGGVLKYGTATQYLNVNDTLEYINVLEGPYAERYPTLKDYAGKMYQRIEIFNQNGISDNAGITVNSISGAAYDLDRYLRAPRYNYYSANVFINCYKYLSALSVYLSPYEIDSVSENNVNKYKYGFGKDKFTSASTYTEFSNDTGSFPAIDFENMGVITVNSDSLYNKGGYETLKSTEKPILIAPLNRNENVSSDDVMLKWKSTPGAENYKLEVSESNTFERKIVNVTTDDFSYNLSDNDALKNNTTYFWRVTAVAPGEDYSGGNICSDIYSFKTSLADKNSQMGITSVVLNKNAEFYVYNISYNAEITSLTAYAALYKDNILTAITPVTVNLPDIQEISSKITADFGDKNGDTVKIFLWDNMKPLTLAGKN